ncbi:MAG: hypothetical protein KJ072_00595 [Verrucomicrobia bacterium]|nr:hypothetical protein [Verrucomicrobiota bacterium]
MRFVGVVATAFLVGWVLNRTAVTLEKRPEPAGFVRGVVQGALMPCTLPALLLGHDVAIYTSHNNGVPYKRGYTVGVNLCGAAFFGLLYRRINRWRNRHASPPQSPSRALPADSALSTTAAAHHPEATTHP